MTSQIVGLLEDVDAPADTLTSATIAIPAMDFVVQWHRCGMTADYLADYFAYAFARREVARSVISTVANELLENAAKFTIDKRSLVHISGWLRGEALEIEVENITNARHAATLSTVLEALSRGEATQLFAERLESKERGGLGLIVLAKDYGARLGARIASPVGAASGSTTISVTVRASIAADEVEQR
ncbi:MAG: hypothetical protein ABI625_19145 [bacterium]